MTLSEFELLCFFVFFFSRVFGDLGSKPSEEAANNALLGCCCSKMRGTSRTENEMKSST